MKKFAHCIVTLLVVVNGTQVALASETIGTILPTFKTTRVCQDVTCTNFGLVNFAPTLNTMTPGATAITITDTAITGHAWGNQIGWINLSPTGLTSVQMLKVNPNSGVITGLGFANTGSWVNFSPAGGGVIINAAGEFVGWAWVSGAYGGWMKFDCASGSTCIKTDWRPIPNRIVATPPSTGGSGTGGGVTVVPAIPTTPTTPVVIPTPTVPPKNTPSTNTNPGVPNRPPVPEILPNTFDPNNTGSPNTPPTDIRDNTTKAPTGSVPQAGGEYREVFPTRQTGFVQKSNCQFCIVVRRDTIPVQNIIRDSVGKVLTTQTLDKERHIIKYGFVPKDMEVRVPVSKVAEAFGVKVNTQTDIDLTSSTVTVGLIAFIVRIIIIIL